MGLSRQAFRSIPGSVGDVRRNAPGLGAGEQAPPIPRCHPLVPSLQPQAETRIIDVQIPVRAAQNRLGLHRRDFLRHDPNVGRVAPLVPIAIEIDAPVEFSDLRDIALQANVGWFREKAEMLASAVSMSEALDMKSITQLGGMS